MSFKCLFGRKKKLNSSSDPSQIESRSSSLSRTQTTQELEQVFKKFDANGDGKISASELGSIMGSLGQTVTDEELQNMIKEFDGDGDGCVDLNEFIELNTKGLDSNDFLESLKDAFSVFDKDGNGTITAEELHDVLKSLGDECSVSECGKMISGIDSDGDGLINFEEFKIMMLMDSHHASLERDKSAPNKKD